MVIKFKMHAKKIKHTMYFIFKQDMIFVFLKKLGCIQFKIKLYF